LHLGGRVSTIIASATYWFEDPVQLTNERIHDQGVIHISTTLMENLCRFFSADAGSVGSIRCESIKAIDDGEDSRPDRYVRTA
jgi:hypothetical protein